MIDLSLKETAYKTIKEKIINLEFSPEQFISESELVDTVGASRTPIREALNRLEQENFIRVIPRRGVFVKGIVPQEVNNLFDTRFAIEPYVIRYHHNKFEIDKLKQIQEEMFEALREGNEEQQVLNDSKLHTTLFHAADNMYITKIMKNVFDHYDRIRIMLSLRRGNWIDCAYDDHTRILDLIFEGDYENAAKIMETHISTSRETTFKILFS